MGISPSDFRAMQLRVAPKHKQVVPEDAVTDESELHRDIVAYCKNRGWLLLHGSMVHRAYRTIGEQDFTILADNGRVFFVECKTRTGKLSTEQLGMQLWAERLGHKIHVVRSMSEFLEILK